MDLSTSIMPADWLRSTNTANSDASCPKEGKEFTNNAVSRGTTFLGEVDFFSPLDREKHSWEEKSSFDREDTKLCDSDPFFLSPRRDRVQAVAGGQVLQHDRPSSRTGRKQRKAQTFVNHQYRDFSHHPVVHDDYCPLADPPKPCFPDKLYQILEDAERDGFSNIISWQPHGRAFKIHQPEVFTSKIIPRYFGKIHYNSFVRQINLYSFLRLYQRTDDHNAYYHEFFLRGRPDLVKQIRRSGTKGHGLRRAACPEGEPNLYTFPTMSSRSFQLAEYSTFQYSANNHDFEKKYRFSSQITGSLSSLANLAYMSDDLEPLPVGHPDVVPYAELRSFLKNFDFGEKQTVEGKPTMKQSFNSRAA